MNPPIFWREKEGNHPTSQPLAGSVQGKKTPPSGASDLNPHILERVMVVWSGEFQPLPAQATGLPTLLYLQATRLQTHRGKQFSRAPKLARAGVGPLRLGQQLLPVHDQMALRPGRGAVAESALSASQGLGLVGIKDTKYSHTQSKAVQTRFVCVFFCGVPLLESTS